MSNEELVNRIQAGIDEADNMLLLWQQCQKFITMLAKKFTGQADIEDLEQEGYFGLCEAVRKYDSDKGIPFINYAAFWLKQYMQRYIQNCCSSVRMPVHAKERLWKYKKVVSEFKREYGWEPSDAHICYLMGISLEQLERLKKSVNMEQIQSLNVGVPGTEEDIPLSDTIASGQELEADVIQDLDSQKLKAEIMDILNSLEGQQSAVIYSRYFHNRTLKETGTVLGVAPERVRLIQNKTLRELRLPKHLDRLRPYADDRLCVAAYRHVGVERFNQTWTSVTEYAAMQLVE